MIERLHMCLGLGRLEKQYISKFQGEKKKKSKERNFSQIEELAQQALAGNLRERYIWDTPKKQGGVNFRQLSKPISKIVGLGSIRVNYA